MACLSSGSPNPSVRETISDYTRAAPTPTLLRWLPLTSPRIDLEHHKQLSQCICSDTKSQERGWLQYRLNIVLSDSLISGKTSKEVSVKGLSVVGKAELRRQEQREPCGQHRWSQSIFRTHHWLPTNGRHPISQQTAALKSQISLINKPSFPLRRFFF